jgi:hypothetical protein
VPLFEQKLGDIVANEARSAGDEDLHGGEFRKTDKTPQELAFSPYRWPFVQQA